MLSSYCYAECRFAECLYAKCRYAKCCYAECHFRIDATYEMRRTEYGEICISIYTHTVTERAYKGNGKVGNESKVEERQRERECVCVCASVD